MKNITWGVFHDLNNSFMQENGRAPMRGDVYSKDENSEGIDLVETLHRLDQITENISSESKGRYTTRRDRLIRKRKMLLYDSLMTVLEYAKNEIDSKDDVTSIEKDMKNVMHL